eukprot:gene1113-1253_t
MGEKGVPDLADWLSTTLKPGNVVGVDPHLISASAAKALIKKFEPLGIKLKAVSKNPVDIVWGASRPPPPLSLVKIHEISIAGETYQSKISKVQELLTKANVVAVVVSMLDEVAWLFNIRASDVDYNPVAISYAIVTTTSAHLFIDPKKIDSALSSYFEGFVELHPYENVVAKLVEFSQLGKVWLDPDQVNWALHSAVNEGSLLERGSPITLPKSLKNDAELTGVRQSHIRDGAALTAFLHWLEKRVTYDPEPFTEVMLMDKLEEFRKRDPLHVSPSFCTIAGYGPNGAIIHYRAEEETCATLGTDNLLLLDSGAQYLDGTTD